MEGYFDLYKEAHQFPRRTFGPLQEGYFGG
jgi:hypothetical protein